MSVPAALVKALVTKLRGIPGMATEMGGDLTRIRAYHYRYPVESRLGKAIETDLQSPGMLVAYRRMGSAVVGGALVFRHKVSVFFRCREVGADEDEDAGYYELMDLMLNGVPAGGDGQIMLYTTIEPNCLPGFDPLPEFVQATDAAGLDYFEGIFNFTER